MQGEQRRRPQRFVATVAGLVVGIAALGLLPAALAAQEGRHTAQCDTPPARGSAAPENDPHLISTQEAAELDRHLRDAAPDRVPHAHRDAVIPVAVHLITAQNGAGDHAEATVREQVAVLNRAFSGGYGGHDTGFRFRLRAVTRTANDAWFTEFPRHESQAKDRLRQGGADVLNLYTADLGEELLGKSSFPQQAESRLAADGVVVDYRTLPGGGRAGYDAGHTVTHETGHWLGLFHTFQNGCTPPGDHVEDTPYERDPARGCPTGRDSCPHRAGTDPVTNFMNYSEDACMTAFTEGQADRMWRAWQAYRG